MPEMGAPQTPSQHGTYVGSSSPYSIGHGGGHDPGPPGPIHHFPHFTPDGIPVYQPIGNDNRRQTPESTFLQTISLILTSLFSSIGRNDGSALLNSSPIGPGGDIGPAPNGPHPPYPDYPPSPASWLSDVDSNANNPQY